MNPFVLPHDQFVLSEVGNIVQWGFRFQFKHQPTHMGPKEALSNIIWIDHRYPHACDACDAPSSTRVRRFQRQRHQIIKQRVSPAILP